jgi:hypothetical protein
MTRYGLSCRRALGRPVFRLLEAQRKFFGRSEEQWLAIPRHRRRLEWLASFMGLERK